MHQIRDNPVTFPLLCRLRFRFELCLGPPFLEEVSFDPMNTQQLSQANRQISISTPLGTDVLLLRSFTFEEELGRPFVLTAECQSEDPDISFESVIGQNVTITLELPNYTQRYFNGTVCSFQQIGFVAELTNYRMIIVPWLSLLGKTANCQIFQNQTVPQIILSVFQTFGFTDVVNQLNGNYPVLPYCVQYNETSLAFVSRLMEQSGIFYYITHTESANTLVLCDDFKRSNTYAGYEVIPYSKEWKQYNSGECIYEWIIEQQVETGGVSVDSYSYTSPKKDLLETATVSQSYLYGDYNRFHYSGQYQTSEEGRALATKLLAEEQTPQMVQRGVTNALGIATGFTFALSNYPRSLRDSMFLTTKMIFRVTSASFETGDISDAGFSATCDFSTIPANRAFRPRRVTPVPRINGPQTATVVSPTEGAEFDADEYGSIYVLFHWDRTTSTAAPTCRIRVAQNSADTNGNSMFIPQVGSEVIVSFEDGNPSAPIVTGRVYNADILPTPDPTTAPYISYFGNASQNNLMSMDATEGAQEVVIKNYNNVLTMQQKDAGEGIVMTDGKSKLTFDTSYGDIKIKSEHDAVYDIGEDSNSYIEGSENKTILGNSSDFILGTKITNVIGMAWNYYLGAYTKFITGAEIGIIMPLKYELIIGTKMEAVYGAKVDWSYEKCENALSNSAAYGLQTIGVSMHNFICGTDVKVKANETKVIGASLKSLMTHVESTVSKIETHGAVDCTTGELSEDCGMRTAIIGSNLTEAEMNEIGGPTFIGE